MAPMLNVPYTFNVFSPNLTAICFADFFQPGLLWGITGSTATNQPVPNQPGQFFIDIQIVIMAGTNANNYDCVTIDVADLMLQNPIYGQITVTNPNGTKSTTQIHLDTASIGGPQA
jgi:hypothetical protein